jgi:Holliday junction resolvase
MNEKEAIKHYKDLYWDYSCYKKPLLPDYARTYPNYIKNKRKTNGITNLIISFIRLKGWHATRISSSGRMIDNTKVVTDVIGRRKLIGSKKWIPGTTQRGTADIDATIDGKSVKIEVKNKYTKDKMSDQQVCYMQQIGAAGGIYIIAYSFEDFVTGYYEQGFGENINKLKLWENIKI